MVSYHITSMIYQYSLLHIYTCLSKSNLAAEQTEVMARFVKTYAVYTIPHTIQSTPRHTISGIKSEMVGNTVSTIVWI